MKSIKVENLLKKEMHFFIFKMKHFLKVDINKNQRLEELKLPNILIFCMQISKLFPNLATLTIFTIVVNWVKKKKVSNEYICGDEL